MKLVYAFPEPLPLGRARGLQVVNTVAALGRAGTQVDLAYDPVRNQDPFSYYGVDKPDSVTMFPVSRSFPWPLDRFHSNRIFYLRLLPLIQSKINQSQVMVRHLKLARMLMRGIPGLPLLYESHEVFADTVSPKMRPQTFALEQAVIVGATAIVANSLSTAKRLSALYGRTDGVSVIPNGVERTMDPPSKPWNVASLNIAYAGSLFPWKGVADLVKAAEELPGCRISIMGGDQAAIDRLRGVLPHAGAEVIYSGSLPHAEVMHNLRHACIAVLPNRNSPDSAFTSPIKLFEYMSAGCAIVASDLPSIREILEDDDAVWFNPGEASSLAAAIRTLVSNPRLAQELGERVRRKSAAFTWDARASRLNSVLDSVTRIKT